MSPTRERNPVQIGIVGLVLAVATVGAALQYDQLQFLSGESGTPPILPTPAVWLPVTT